MAKVMTIFRVYPNEGEFDKAFANIKENLKPQSMQAEDVAFGIRLILVLFTFDDTEITSSQLEEKLKKTEGVNEVEVKDESLM